MIPLFSSQYQSPEHATMNDFSYEKRKVSDFHSTRLERVL